jgi:molybdopterin converting factor small subunit
VDIKVRSVGFIKMLLGEAELYVSVPEGTTVAGLLSWLREEKGEKFAPYSVTPDTATTHAPLRVLVNGRDIAALGGTQTTLAEGDDVLMFMPIAGG